MALAPPRLHRLGLACAVLVLASAAGCAPEDPLERVRELQQDREGLAASLEILRELVDERPDDPEVQYRYGMALIASGDASIAMWSLRKAAESEEWFLPATVTLGRGALTLGRWQEAIDAANRILAEDPEHVQALLLRAEAQVRSRRAYEEGLADAERVLDLAPDDASGLVWKTAALLGLGRADEAAEALDELEAMHRDDTLGIHGSPSLCAAQATFRKEKGELEAAAEHYGDCLERFPGNPLVLEEALGFFDGIGQAKRSEEILRAALAEAPERFELRVALFDRLRAAGREEEAEALLREATELESRESATAGWSALALYKLETGDFEGAASAFAEARRRDPGNSAEMLFAHADALVVAGRHEEALRLAELMWVAPHRQLVEGRVALERGQAAEALARFSEANKLWPNNAVARYYTAVAAEELGDFRRAIEDYRYSMRIDAKVTDAYLRLARLMRAAGRPAAALDALNFQAGGRVGEREAALLRLEIMAATDRPVPPAALRSGPEPGDPRWPGAATAALARGFTQRLGPEFAVEFVDEQAPVIDLRDPAHVDALRFVVEALAQSGKAEAALARVDAALAANPDEASFHALRGDALAAADAPAEEVREAYERALALDAEESTALAGLAGLESAGASPDRALELYDRALRADPEDRAVVRDSADLLARLGRPDDAEDRLARLLRAHPYDAEAALTLAELRIERGAPEARTRSLVERAGRFGAGEEAAALLRELGPETEAGEAAEGVEPEAEGASD